VYQAQLGLSPLSHSAGEKLAPVPQGSLASVYTAAGRNTPVAVTATKPKAHAMRTTDTMRMGPRLMGALQPLRAPAFHEGTGGDRRGSAGAYLSFRFVSSSNQGDASVGSSKKLIKKTLVSPRPTNG
jgi:hypothetical protein